MTTKNLPIAIPVEDYDNNVNEVNNNNSNINSTNNNQATIATLNNLPVAPAIHVNPLTFDNTYVNQPYYQTQFVGNEKMAFAWRLSKTIKFFAVIDIFFCLFYLFIFPPFSLIAILPLMGYYGAKDYNICKTYLYSIFVFFSLIVRIYSYTLSNTFSSLLICLLSIMVETWILRILYSFTKAIKVLDETELLQVIEPNWQPLQTSFVWY